LAFSIFVGFDQVRRQREVVGGQERQAGLIVLDGGFELALGVGLAAGLREP
jgi:hypothetical protein